MFNTKKFSKRRIERANREKKEKKYSIFNLKFRLFNEIYYNFLKVEMAFFPNVFQLCIVIAVTILTLYFMI